MNKEYFVKALKSQIDSDIEELKDEIIKDSIERLEKEIKSRLAYYSLSVLESYDIRTNGNELQIKVRIER